MLVIRVPFSKECLETFTPAYFEHHGIHSLAQIHIELSTDHERWLRQIQQLGDVALQSYRTHSVTLPTSVPPPNCFVSYSSLPHSGPDWFAYLLQHQSLPSPQSFEPAHVQSMQSAWNRSVRVLPSIEYHENNTTDILVYQFQQKDGDDDIRSALEKAKLQLIFDHEKELNVELSPFTAVNQMRAIHVWLQQQSDLPNTTNAWKEEESTWFV
jgi:hypothetical protein